MIKLLHESFKNLPRWIVDNFNKNNYALELLNRKGIDLYNCTFEEADDLKVRDSRWKDNNLIPVFLIQDINNTKLYMWGYLDPYLIIDGKYASQHNRQWLIDNSLHKGFINISANKKAQKDRYIDPRNVRSRSSAHDHYAGQRYSDYSKGYHTSPGRDKSGYEIPDPSKKLAKLYDINMDNYAKVLDRYYIKINNIKAKLFNIDIKTQNSETFDNAMRSFGYIVRNYNEMTHKIPKIINNIENKGYTGSEAKEYFESDIKWISEINYINKELINIQLYLKELEQQ